MSLLKFHVAVEGDDLAYGILCNMVCKCRYDHMYVVQ